MGPSTLLDYADDDPTERFTLQVCPECLEMTSVPLACAYSPCEVCGERIEVCPLEPPKT